MIKTAILKKGTVDPYCEPLLQFIIIEILVNWLLLTNLANFKLHLKYSALSISTV